MSQPRPEVKRFFESKYPAAAAATQEPAYSVCLATRRIGPGMTHLDNIECAIVREYRFRFDAERCAADLAATPGAIAEYARIHHVESPEYVVVYDANGTEVFCRPCLGVFPRQLIGVYLATFVRGASQFTPPFDIEDTAIVAFELHESVDAIDWAENAARNGVAHDHAAKLKRADNLVPNGVIVRTTDGHELARFSIAEQPRPAGLFATMLGLLWKRLGM